MAIRDTERIIDEAVARATLHRTATAEAAAHGVPSADPLREGTEATSQGKDAPLPLAGTPQSPGASTRASQFPTGTPRQTEPSSGVSFPRPHGLLTSTPLSPSDVTLPLDGASRRTDPVGTPTRTPPTSTPAGTLVAVTACPTGIAHTFMAAEALTRAARAKGYAIRVETQGSVGAKNTLTPEEIAQADAVIIGADTHVSTERFVGKRLLQTSVGEALKQADHVVEQALALPEPMSATRPVAAPPLGVPVKAEPAGAYKHLLTGVSFMLPFVVAGGLLLALSFVFGIDAYKQPGTLPAALKGIGDAAFALMVPALAGYLAYSIADRPGLAPGFIGGMLANQLNAGFLGGIAAGFLAGYVARTLRDRIRLPANLEGLKPVLVIPLLSALIVGLLMTYVIGAPVAALMGALTRFLTGMSGTNAVLLGLLLGAMVAFDTGGPVNKAAYAFAVGLLGSSTFTPMAAVMVAGMTPPLGLALATVVAKSRFTLQEREAGKAAAVLGLAFITEGAIPYAARDPLRVIPSIVFGSAIAGAVSMGFGCALRAPHGGVFVLAIPNAVQPLGYYVLALVAGTLATTLALIVLKRPLTDTPTP
ncbi:PTS fructose transporter subunit EIIBC [Corallococcus sp. CA047B]|nr:PTS fructose transporter subunit EIIBC [Corallococcus sp. CA047B]